jgi:periplasmic divalent cation tolerance protein
MEDFVMILTTTDSKEEAKRISKDLVKKRLAGCVEINGPIQSTYRWKGSVEYGEEWLCSIKSRKDLINKVEMAIKEIHPYDVPEIVVLPIIAGSNDYLTWLHGQLETR